MVRKHPSSSVLRGTGEDADAGTWENTEPELKGSLSSSWRLSRKKGDLCRTSTWPFSPSALCPPVCYHCLLWMIAARSQEIRKFTEVSSASHEVGEKERNAKPVEQERSSRKDPAHGRF